MAISLAFSEYGRCFETLLPAADKTAYNVDQDCSQQVHTARFMRIGRYATSDIPTTDQPPGERPHGNTRVSLLNWRLSPNRQSRSLHRAGTATDVGSPHLTPSWFHRGVRYIYRRSSIAGCGQVGHLACRIVVHNTTTAPA